MSKTIKVIDLLNKIANGEEVPEKIRFEKDIFKYVKCWEQYVEKDTEKPLLKIISAYNYSGLNDTVEIIEEEPEIDIQGIEDFKTNYAGDFVEKELAVYFNNKILPAIKQLDNQIKNK